MSNNNGKERAGRDVATQMRLMAWFTQNKASLTNYASRKDVCEALYADTGLLISTYMCSEFEKALGIKRSAGKGRLKPGTSKGKSAEVLARALYAVMQELTAGMRAALEPVIPDDQWEQHINAVKTIAQRRGIESLNTNAVPVTTGTQTVNT